MIWQMTGWIENLLQNAGEITLQAAFMAGLILAARFALKKMPGKYKCMLWAAGFLVFLVPVSAKIPVAMPGGMVWQTSDRTEEMLSGSDGRKTANVVMESSASEKKTAQDSGMDSSPANTGNVKDLLVLAAAGLWILGMTILAGVQCVRYLRMKRCLESAVKITGRIYETDRIVSPVLFGILRPRIYLPVGMEPQTAAYAVLHEQAHFERKDMLWKLTAFLICLAYWWNPVVWLMYRGLEEDMEQACDEEVLKRELSPASYAQSLLNTEKYRHHLMGGVFFLSGNIRRRMDHILKFQKTNRNWMPLCMGLMLTLSVVPFLRIEASDTNPSQAWAKVAEQYADLPDYEEFQEYSVHEDKNNRFQEEEGTLLIRFHGEHSWEDEKEELFSEMGEKVLESCPGVRKVIFGWNEIKYPQQYPYNRECSGIELHVSRENKEELTLRQFLPFFI